MHNFNIICTPESNPTSILVDAQSIKREIIATVWYIIPVNIQLGPFILQPSCANEAEYSNLCKWNCCLAHEDPSPETRTSCILLIRNLDMSRCKEFDSYFVVIPIPSPVLPFTSISFPPNGLSIGRSSLWHWSGTCQTPIHFIWASILAGILSVRVENVVMSPTPSSRPELAYSRFSSSRPTSLLPYLSGIHQGKR